jgi:hypothetical protein
MRSLKHPVLHAAAGGITVLTGANVALAPAMVVPALSRLAGPSRRLAGDEVALLAFAAPRAGLVGMRGVLRVRDGEVLLHDVEAFGAASAMRGFGIEVGRFLSGGGRFSEDVTVEGADVPGPVATLVEGLAEGGLAPGPVTAPCRC